jgi:hypothetical protein
VPQEEIRRNENDAPTIGAFSRSGKYATFFTLPSPLSPIGVPRGVVPGRVTGAHDPAAVTWDGTGSWWTDANNNQAAIDRMVSRSIRGLTNQKSDAQAWRADFHYFNRTHGRGNTGYQAGEKVAIKANVNNTTDHGTIDRLNSSPHVLLSLVRQLTGPGKVPQSSIGVFDSSRFNDRLGIEPGRVVNPATGCTGDYSPTGLMLSSRRQ